MEKRSGVFFQPGRSMVRGTGQRPWGEPGTQIELKYSGVSETPVSSSLSTCRRWPLSFALVFVPRRNFHWRGFRTPGCLSVLVFKWFWETLFVHWQGVVIGFPNRFEIFSNLIGVGGSVTEKVASHFAAFLDLKVGHLDLETIIANTYFVNYEQI